MKSNSKMAEIPFIARTEDPALLQAFRHYEDHLAVANVKHALALGSLFMLLGYSLDWIVFPEHGWLFLQIRLVCTVLLGCIFLFLGEAPGPRICYFASVSAALLPMIGICAMIARTGGGNSVYYAGLNLILVGMSLVLRWTFVNSLVVIAACFLAYATSVILAPRPLDRTVLFNNSYFLGVTAVFVLVGCYFYEKLRFREFCLHAEVESSHQLLASKNRQLSELDEAKTRFFANISHELRTPLTIMLGITERLSSVLGHQAVDSSIHEMTAMLEQNGLRLLKLIDDLLDLVRFDTGHADVNRQPTRIAALTDGLLRSLAHLAEQDRVALLWECQTAYESIQLDRDKFDKILLNLVINAIKFTPSGGSITVKVTVADELLRLVVEDTGVGIPTDVLPHIFERFWQVDDSSTRKFRGAGIGLALVRSLTEAMGGAASVNSKLGCGTVFTIELPTAASAPEATPSTTASDEPDPLQDGGRNIAQLHRKAAISMPGKVAARSALPTQPSGQLASPVIGLPGSTRPLVLIADDEPDIRRFLRMQMDNVEVIEASDGAEALELARLRRPQLALLDHMMPEMDGIEVCRRIRENHSTRSVAVIILTARADEQTKLAALQAGASDFLTKPFSSAELALRLENQLAMGRIRREMANLNSELQAAIEQLKENEVLLVRNEKLSSLGRMSAGIIHEINNPLNYASAGIHTLATFAKALPASEQADFADILKDIREGVERVSQIVIDLRQFTRDDDSISGDADLAEIVTRAHRMVSHQFGTEIGFHLTTPDRALISGNPNQLVQVFINFFQNSIDAIQHRIHSDGGEPGRIDVAISPADGGWQVIIRDNGIGIPPDHLPNIFDPFFTSKEVGKGMGLGLSISHRILLTHQALIEVDSHPGEFACFRLVFPPRLSATRQLRAPRAESVLDQSA
ncbi:MAG: ATP-binding protein [Verrucomicrobia bacterium]|nr:ATP-binding protein [Verrucomicrobiota bacterium]